MNDLISKASVCEILADIYPTDGEKVVAVKEIDKAYETILNLPYAERHGRWEYTKELYSDPNGNHLFYGKICSECNSVSPYDSPYCMNCGANMQQGVTLVGAKMDEVLT